jgi:hypothetical protein
VLYIHNYSLFFVPVIGALAFANELHDHPFHTALPVDAPEFYRDQWTPEQRSEDYACQVRDAIGAFVIPMFLWLPWGIVVLGQIQNIASGYWIQGDTGGGALYSLYMLFWGFGMPDRWQPLAIIITFGVVLFALLRRPKRMLIWLGFMPLVLAVTLSILWKPILLFRGLIPSAPFIYMAVLAAILERKSALKLALVAVFLVPVIAAGVWGYFYYNPTNKGDVEATIAKVRAEWQPGDIIFHVNDGSMVGWQWYAPDLPQVEMNICGQRNPAALSDQTRAALGFQMGDPPLGRIWVVSSEGPTSTLCEHQSAASLTQGPPRILVRNDEYIYSGVWLVQNP